MRTIALFLFIFLTVSVPIHSFSAVTQIEAQAAAVLRVVEVAEYSRAKPDAAGAFTPWAGEDVSPGEAILVHQYPDLAPSYYIVPLIGAEAECDVVRDDRCGHRGLAGVR